MKLVPIKMSLCLILIAFHHILFSQITVTTVTDTELNGVRPTNIVSGPTGETLLMKGTKIYTYTDQVTDVFNCSICGDILDITFVGDTMYIANGTRGIVKRFGDSTLQVTSLRATRLVSNAAGEIYGIHNLDGLVVWDGSEWLQWTTSTSNLPTNDIFDLAYESGILWMATQEGLISWDGTSFSTESLPGGLSPTFYDMEIDSFGIIWVASASGGVGKFDGNAWTTFPETFNPLQRVENLAIINGSEVWTSQNGEGLYRYDGDSFELISYEELGQPGWEINRVLYGDVQDRLWIQNDFSPLLYLTSGTTSLANITDFVEILVFPNPVKEVLNIKIGLEENLEIIELELYTLEGKKVYANKVDNNYDNIIKFNLPPLPSGLYELLIKINRNTYATKKIYVLNYN